MKTSIRFYNDHEVRAIWDEEKNQWFFSALDIIASVNNQEDYAKVRNYWKYLKAKLKKEGNELVSATTQLKLTAADGKKYATDCFPQNKIENLVKAIPNKNAADFLDWFTYSDNTIDGKSKKKAYEFIESNLLENKDVGTTKGLQQIHAFLFGDLYDFAGQIRTKTISKGGFTFCLAQYLEQALASIDKMPENTFDEIADKYVEMNVAHPFMEGNGRSTRIWLDMILKKRLKKCVDWSQINKNDYLQAMEKSAADSTAIKTLLLGALTDKIDDREIFMKGIDYSYYYEEN